MRIATAVRSLLFAAAVSMVPAASFAGIFVSIGIGAPPVLPVYVQPICPAAGYIWTPGYWSYDEDGGYYWVPGAWVLAPYQGALWTPGYWGYENDGYGFHPGYWGLHVGFYGGVDYGYGYGGHGFEGGYWNRGVYNYNRSVTNVNVVNVHNVYNKTVINNYNNNHRVSFNGGRGGLQERPNAQEQAFTREQHTNALPAQQQNEQHAMQNRQQFASVNHGRPQNLARPEPVSYNRNAAATPTVNRTANLPTNHTTLPANHTPAIPTNNGLRTTNPAGNGQRPLITARPGNTATQPNRMGQPNAQTFNRAPNSNGYPQRPQPQQNMAQQNVVRPQANSRPPQANPRPPQANTVQSQPRPSFNQPRTAPQQMRQQAPQQRRQEAPQMRQQAPQQMRQPAPQQMRQQAPQMQARPQEPHGGGGAPQGGHEGGGHGGGHGR